MNVPRTLAAVPPPVTARAPGKVNLHLGVTALRDDGYHELSTVFQAVSLYDDVTASVGRGVSVEVSGEGAEFVPTDGSNLAVRAAVLLGGFTGNAPDVHLAIRKGIPVAGGMAGGSADAAATLVACDALWGTALTREALTGLAAQLGSDVPFCLHGGTALGTGRGERLTPVLARGEYAWVFALADGGLSTPAVFADYDARPTSARKPGTVRRNDSPDGVLAALRGADPLELAGALHNDLQEAALRLRPDLQRVLDAAGDLGALAAIVSGSGPTVALLARSSSDATALAAELVARGVCKGVRRAEGPVPGARLIADSGLTEDHPAGRGRT